MPDEASRRDPAEMLLETLAGGVAHNFNNLVGSVQASIQMMRQRLGTDAFPPELASIDGLLARASTLARSLVTLSSGLENAPRDVALVDVVEDTLELVEPRLLRRGITLDRMYGRAPIVHTVASAVQLMVMYLLNEAEDSGSREVRLGIGRSGDDAWIEITPCAAQSRAQGRTAWEAAEAIAARVGARLERVDGADGRPRGRILIAVDSAKQDRPRTTAGVHNPTVGRPMSVLLLDDETVLRKMVSSYLGMHGISVSAVEDGERGISLAERQKFDVVLLDLVMPGMRGEEVLARLVELQPNVPIIVMSGLMDQDLGDSLLQRGAWSVVAKPLQLERLLMLCREATSRSNGARGSSE